MTATTTVPYQASRATLARASLAALAGGVAILVLFVLPAEYGIDPTGVGKSLGLTRMAAGEDAAQPADAAPAPVVAPAAYAVPAQTQSNIEKKTGYRNDEKTITLAPHTGIELKARMKAGDTFNFRWTSTGPVRADMHGEPTGGKEDEFTDYWKQKDIQSAQGSFTAPFAGTHGWYWKNREDVPITITVKLDGFYDSVFERE
ncbi:hypothetical protein M9978_13630 [Sphingomonas sp. MG17]|uniref:Transmembrane anchor protein n=1 Tax=Sphingomonas tagetis TaxID=2949092 RepID=A0A9X2HPL7_9SPHN|nr:hypothetical protein [Sphingomonas tagetis]MCP3731464.1 hypothetical protein [Sphingomonas tagetis]